MSPPEFYPFAYELVGAMVPHPLAKYQRLGSLRCGDIAMTLIIPPYGNKCHLKGDQTKNRFLRAHGFDYGLC